MTIMLRMTGTLGQRRILHPQTLDYIARLQAVGGHDPAFDSANDYLIRELVALGGPYWDTMGTMTTLCGKLFAGLLVPLRDGMDVGTNVDNNFVSGDYNAKTGLVGDGSSKYIDSNRNNNADGQNNISMGVYISAVGATAITEAFIGSRHPTNASPLTQMLSLSGGDKIARLNSGTTGTFTSSRMPGYFGSSRNNSSNMLARFSGANNELTSASSEPYDNNQWVFARNHIGSAAFSNCRLSLYHIGPALNLATLDGILTEYMARIAEVTL